MRIVYYDHAISAPQQGFRDGEASHVVALADGEIASRGTIAIGPNSLHALFEHGVVEQLSRLPLLVGPLAPGRDAVFRPTALSDACHILYEADRRTYGRTWEFVIGREAGAELVEYRIAIDNREYQRTLSRLQYLVTMASRSGYGVRLRL